MELILFGIAAISRSFDSGYADDAKTFLTAGIAIKLLSFFFSFFAFGFLEHEEKMSRKNMNVNAVLMLLNIIEIYRFSL